MALTFDATLKDMGRESPQGFLAAFDQPPTTPVKPLNVDLSAVTTLADLILGIGDPPEEIIHFDFQSSAAAWKHADLMVYNALVYAHYRVPVHTIILLLRPQAAHANLNGASSYAPRPGRGKMNFSYEIVRLWSGWRPNYWPRIWAWCRWRCSAGCRKAGCWRTGWRSWPSRSWNGC